MTAPFPCTSCGACCCLAYLRADLLAGHGISTRADGACEHLAPGNRCGIYEARPPVCRVDESRPWWIKEGEWHMLNAAHCNALQEALGIVGQRVTIRATEGA